MEKQSKKKNKLRSILVQVIIGGIIGLIGGIIGSYFYANNPFPGEFNMRALLLSIIFIFIAAFININIHEFGHFIFGKMFGYSLLSYRISFLAWNNENGKMKFSIIKNRGYSGLCAMMPPEYELANYKNILFYAGGITFNIISGFIFITLPFLLTNLSDTANLFLFITGGIALVLGIINLMSFVSGNNPTDGKIIWSLILKKPFAKKLIEINKMTSQLSAGIRPRDINIYSFEDIDSPEAYEMITVLYSYYKALDSKEHENMFHYADLLEKNIEFFPSPALPSLYYELCFIGCITDNEDRAKTYYKKAGKILQNDRDVNGLRIKAYYEYYINKNEEQSLIFCEDALAVQDKFPIKGLRLMEKDLVEDLKKLIAAS